MDGSGEDVLGRFIDASHHLSADALPGAVAEHAAGIGAREAVVYLASYEQRTLLPLAGAGVPAREPLEIDATLAGRAYRLVTTVTSDSAAGDGVRLWVALLNGTTRLGVLELLFDRVDPARDQAARRLAGLVAELVVSRARYGDAFPCARRREPMSLAAEIQWGLLPPLTFSDRRVTIAGVLEPTYEVAGDSFDYALNGDVLSFAVIDAMGHGFEATMLASVAVGAYRHSRRLGADLPGTYAAMDAIIAQQFGEDRFLTAYLGELDVAQGSLRWLNAGHPPPLLLRGGAARPMECQPTLPVGFGGAVAQVAEERLEPGDHLLLYTDGVVEARTPDGELFDTDRLADLLTRAVNADVPASETVRRLSHGILEYQGGALQDDATTVLVTWHGREPV